MCKQLFMCVCVYICFDLYMHTYKQFCVDLIEIYRDEHKNVYLFTHPPAVT